MLLIIQNEYIYIVNKREMSNRIYKKNSNDLILLTFCETPPFLEDGNNISYIYNVNYKHTGREAN